MKLFPWIIGAITTVIVVLFLFGARQDHQEQQRWQTFARDNHCRVTGRVRESTAWSTSGHFVTIPGKTIYTCDGGYTEERDDQ